LGTPRTASRIRGFGCRRRAGARLLHANYFRPASGGCSGPTDIRRQSIFVLPQVIFGVISSIGQAAQAISDAHLSISVLPEVIFVMDSSIGKAAQAISNAHPSISVLPQVIFVMDSSIGQAAHEQAQAFKKKVAVGSVRYIDICIHID